MARPALSATRGIDIIDLFATFPERGFTLSEVMRATGINPASCHAVLGALVERGYARRDSRRKTFHLGPVLAAIGEAATRAEPLLAHARATAHELAVTTGMPVLLTAAVGEDMVGIIAVANDAGRGPGLRTAERRPLVPPLGAPFLAWAGEAEVAAWLARGAHAGEQAVERELRAALAMIRGRGFQVSLRQSDQPRLAAEIGDMARGYRDGVMDRVASLDPIVQPAVIEPDAAYDVILIAAPVFDRDGRCAYNMCLGDFTAPLSGGEVLALSDRLLAACVQVMQADRA